MHTPTGYWEGVSCPPDGPRDTMNTAPAARKRKVSPRPFPGLCHPQSRASPRVPRRVTRRVTRRVPCQVLLRDRGSKTFRTGLRRRVGLRRDLPRRDLYRRGRRRGELRRWVRLGRSQRSRAQRRRILCRRILCRRILPGQVLPVTGTRFRQEPPREELPARGHRGPHTTIPTRMPRPRARGSPGHWPSPSRSWSPSSSVPCSRGHWRWLRMRATCSSTPRGWWSPSSLPTS